MSTWSAAEEKRIANIETALAELQAIAAQLMPGSQLKRLTAMKQAEITALSTSISNLRRRLEALQEEL
jgi:hypothetical protein